MLRASTAFFTVGQALDADPARGDTREVTHEISFSPDPSQLVSGHVLTYAATACAEAEKGWDPASDGPIASIDLLYEHRIVLVETLGGNSQNGGVFPRLLLEQEAPGGVEYYVSFDSDQFCTTGQGMAWAASSSVPEDLTGLTEKDFQRVEPAGMGSDGQFFPLEQPDFSAGGGRIRFGFAPSTSTTDPLGRRSVFRVNDFRVVVRRAPPEIPSVSSPGLWALGALLSGSGLGLLVRGRRGRPRLRSLEEA